ncbi:hypothetical protein ACFVWR_17150 [Leifsonia sp. NPDC058292]|uniref:hypothetical protein n=1 Tax=Leifsonia sp. NPDC058292 TaxID=3346428 RepID=UPI0036DEBF47
MTQNEPIMDGSDEAGQGEKVQGLVDQLAADLQLRPQEDAEKLLRQRLADADIQLDDEQISRIVQSVHQGPSQVD